MCVGGWVLVVGMDFFLFLFCFLAVLYDLLDLSLLTRD